MKSIIYTARELKRYVKDKKYIIIYGTGSIALKCKSLLDNCHVHVDFFMISDNSAISINDRKNSIEKIPLRKISEFPLTEDMTPENTGVIVAANGKYLKDIKQNLERIGINDIYYFSGNIKGSSVGITTQAGCSVGCEYCPQNVFIKKYHNLHGGGQEAILTLEQFKKYLGNIPRSVLIYFAGFAEPFLNSECSAMIQYAYEQGYNINTFTTLIGLTETILDEIFDKTNFVIHLPDEENKTGIVINEAYTNLVKKIFELNDRERRILLISAPMGINKKLLPYIPKDIVIHSEAIDRAGNVKELPGYNLSGAVTCERTYNRLDRNVLLPNGDLLLCCNDWSLKNILGNLKEQTWMDIMEGKKAGDFRKSMLCMEGERLICHSCNYAVELFD